MRKTIREGTPTVNQAREQTFTPAFPELELAVTELLNARTSIGLFATILSDKTTSVSGGNIYSRKVVIADEMGLHTVHQFCYQSPSGESESFGLSKDSVNEVDVKKD
ncbi:hypothetical protein AV540_25880 [Brevibacillus parabrevis]|uniref:hypothetical protein n=1 Tax=Brevibacillus parabrevis TaxID=54914 RepID=UPI0007AB67B3|nr:hypothetical protein [Brevibacillus parabrevis]KZE39147.1 hypothetical protein AV540_25880 [Brevibacillus parabrevis]